jgi:hypothetical protein
VLTSNQAQAAGYGTPVPVDVFSEDEALAFLAQRTGRVDDVGARELAEELGWLPLALAQAAAVIDVQHLDYPIYLARLRATQVQDYLSVVKCFGPVGRREFWLRVAGCSAGGGVLVGLALALGAGGA